MKCHQRSIIYSAQYRKSLYKLQVKWNDEEMNKLRTKQLITVYQSIPFVPDTLLTSVIEELSDAVDAIQSRHYFPAEVPNKTVEQ